MIEIKSRGWKTNRFWHNLFRIIYELMESKTTISEVVQNPFWATVNTKDVPDDIYLINEGFFKNNTKFKDKRKYSYIKGKKLESVFGKSWAILKKEYYKKETLLRDDDNDGEDFIYDPFKDGSIEKELPNVNMGENQCSIDFVYSNNVENNICVDFEYTKEEQKEHFDNMNKLYDGLDDDEEKFNNDFNNMNELQINMDDVNNVEINMDDVNEFQIDMDDVNNVGINMGELNEVEIDMNDLNEVEIDLTQKKNKNGNELSLYPNDEVFLFNKNDIGFLSNNTIQNSQERKRIRNWKIENDQLKKKKKTSK